MNLNLLIDNIGQSQLAFFAINALNVLAKKNELGIAPLLFFGSPAPPCASPQFPCMQMTEAWLQPGITIATSPVTALSLPNMPRATRRIFYVWDPYWLRGNKQFYAPLAQLFKSEGMEFIVRNEFHGTLLHNCFNVGEYFVVDNFDIKQLIGVIRHGEENGTNHRTHKE